MLQQHAMLIFTLYDTSSASIKDTFSQHYIYVCHHVTSHFHTIHTTYHIIYTIHICYIFTKTYINYIIQILNIKIIFLITFSYKHFLPIFLKYINIMSRKRSISSLINDDQESTSRQPSLSQRSCRNRSISSLIDNIDED